MSTRFLDNLEKRQVEAAQWNAALPTAKAPWKKRVRWAAKAVRPLPPKVKKYAKQPGYKGKREAFETEWREDSGKWHGSIAGALNEAFPKYWLAGVFKLVADEAQLMAPLLVKEIIRFSQQTYAAQHGTGHAPHIGRGIGMAIGLLLLSMLQSVCQHQFFFRSMTHGALFRASLISATYKRALKLSVGARSSHPNGKLMAYLSSDVSSPASSEGQANVRSRAWTTAHNGSMPSGLRRSSSPSRSSSSVCRLGLRPSSDSLCSSSSHPCRLTLCARASRSARGQW